MAGEHETPFLGKALYWSLGAPILFLATARVGTLPLLLLSSAAKRAPILDLVSAPYGILVFVSAANLTWACWRGVRGDPPSRSFRPFPRLVRAVSLALGLASGAVAYLRAA